MAEANESWLNGGPKERLAEERKPKENWMKSKSGGNWQYASATALIFCYNNYKKGVTGGLARGKKRRRIRMPEGGKEKENKNAGRGEKKREGKEKQERKNGKYGKGRIGGKV